MVENEQSRQAGIEALQEIKQIMERSSRFISLSGLSGMAAGLCALVGAFLASRELGCWNARDCLFNRLQGPSGAEVEQHLYLIAGATFLAAFVLAFLFTWFRSKQKNYPIWGAVARRLMWAVAIPIVTGAIYLYKMIELKQYELVAPGCLVFYGLALVNASKYTFREIKYLGYTEILLGLVNAWWVDQSLICWAIGFGVLHVVYGGVMWWRHERREA